MEKPHPAAESQLSKKEQVHDSIVSSVLDGTYPPGTILTEKALVEAFQFSKSPIREALIELCNENILRNIPRLGYEVTRLTEDDIRDIRGLRLSLECDFLIHYGSQITKEEINTLSSALTAEKNVAGTETDLLENWQENVRFHLVLFSFYKNPYAYHVLEDALNRQTMAFAQFYWDKWRRKRLVVSDRLHKEIVNDLSKGNIQAAVRTLEKDISDYNGLDIPL